MDCNGQKFDIILEYYNIKNFWAFFILGESILIAPKVFAPYLSSTGDFWEFLCDWAQLNKYWNKSKNKIIRQYIQCV